MAGRGRRLNWRIELRAGRSVVVGLMRPHGRPGRPLRQVLCDAAELSGMPEVTAQRQLQSLHRQRLELLEQETPIPKPKSGHTVRDLIAAYKVEHLPSLSDSSYLPALDFWGSFLGALDLAQLDHLIIGRGRNRLVERGRKPGTIVRYLAVISSVCNHAVRLLHWMPDNPVPRVARPKVRNEVVRWLNDDERTRLLAACAASSSPDLLDAVLFALATGCRKGEMYQLEWSNLDLKRGVVLFRARKNGKDLAQNLPAAILQQLRRRKLRSQTTRVFPKKLQRVWEESLRIALVTDFRWHDLRHSCASYLAQEGFSLPEIGLHLGHESIRSTQRYAHLSPQTTLRTSSALNTRIFGGG